MKIIIVKGAASLKFSISLISSLNDFSVNRDISYRNDI